MQGYPQQTVQSRHHHLDASAVIEGLSGAECPAGAAIELVANTASDGGTLRPSSADIAILRDISAAVGLLPLLLEYTP